VSLVALAGDFHFKGMDLFNDLVFAGIRRPDRERTGRAGIRIIPVAVRAGDLSRFLHVLPALHVIRTFVVKTDVKILRTPGGKGRGLPLAHLPVAMWTNGLVYLHFILLCDYVPRAPYRVALEIFPGPRGNDFSA
jgi:hypothetical protein